mmetsp:Transcript_6467/g.9915  ORF Transcript_6467/g.9915 Transcript_6467/m.9915 type:complete len:226 (+) Transcript_6467:282-959(+)
MTAESADQSKCRTVALWPLQRAIFLYPADRSKTSIIWSLDEAASRRPSGLNLTSETAESKVLAQCTRCSERASNTCSPPCLHPTARCAPSGLKCRHRPLFPNATMRSSRRLAAHHTYTFSPSDAVANTVGLVGSHATPYRSALWPYISTSGVSSISQMSDRCVPAMNTSEPGMQSSPRKAGAAGPLGPEAAPWYGLFTGVAPSTAPSLRSPPDTSHRITCPSFRV